MGVCGTDWSRGESGGWEAWAEAAVKEAKAGAGVVKVEKRGSGGESQGQEGRGLDL